MAWTTVPTFVSGNILTAAQMNGLGNDLTVLRGDYARAKRASTDITINSTNWANVDTNLDLVLAAETGDIVEFAISALYENTAVSVYLDVVTMVSGSPVNSFAYDTTPANPPTNYGIQGWSVVGSLANQTSSGSVFRKLVAGDISSSTVTLRLRYATETATNRKIRATAAQPLEVWARNHGPVEI